MYGLLRTPLTYAQYVDLTLSLPYAKAALVSIQVEANRISAGGLGSLEFYAQDCPDEKSAQLAYETAMLKQALTRR